MEGVCFQSLQYGMLNMLLISLLELVFVLATTSTTSAAADDRQLLLLPQALPGCSDRCGNVTIPYPFGMAEGCYHGSEFFINCTTTTLADINVNVDESSIGPIPLMRANDSLVRVTNISLDGELHVLLPIIRRCGDENVTGSRLALPNPFTISDSKNKFLTVGCNAVATFQGTRRGPNLRGGPDKERLLATSTSSVASCNDYTAANDDDSCSGDGCGQAYIPSGLQAFEAVLFNFGFRGDNNQTGKWYSGDPYLCKYAFFVEQGAFTFSINTSLQQLNHTSHLPILLNWKIGDQGPCSEAQNSKDFLCKGNSTCVNWPNINGWSTGYICQCLPGYQGNPYHPDGCQDIDECRSQPCKNGTHCVNSPGSYICTILPNHFELILIRVTATAFIIMFVLLVGTACCLCWGVKQRKYIKLKEKYFQENGGLLLQHKLASHHGAETTRIFTAEELEKATNNYHDSRVLGTGSYGIVYKGILPDNRMVAIKKSRLAAPTQSEQFVNELIVLSQINHKNVVRLLGCCLESEVPLLVYEFITNGTLFEHIHGERNKGSSLAWELRLKIGAETAEALAYLHSSTFMQIIHRDVKAMNILLDENYTAKVSDFGSSVLIPLDHTEIVTFVQGTLGYLDPEYLQSSQLTEKSDVYSFGVVMAELLTRKVAFSYDRPEEERSLARQFVCAMEEERLNGILDDDIVDEQNMETVRNVARLVNQCLRLKGEERPTMREVATELEGMRIMINHPRTNSADLRHEDHTSLMLGSPSNASFVDDVRGYCGSTSGRTC